MKHAVKLTGETPDAYLVGGYGVVWGGCDLSGEWFDKDSDLWLDRMTGDPMLMYDHGFDKTVGRSVLGHVVTKTVDDVGLWIEGQVEKASEYAERVMDLVRKGMLGFSTGSVTHLVEITKTGYIKSWPIVEASLTATPCEPRTVGVEDLTAIGEANPTARSFIDLVKSLPAGNTPMASADGDPPEGSYEDLIADLSRMVRIRFQIDPYTYTWCYVVATFPDYCVVCVSGEGAATYYRVAYVLGVDLEPVLGDVEPVQAVYAPIELPPADTEMTAMVADYTARSATSLSARLRGLHAGRVKEGRVLSAANRKRLAAAQEAMAGLLKDFEDLLTATEPKTTESEAGTAKAVVEVQAAYARILAIATGVEVPA